MIRRLTTFDLAPTIQANGGNVNGLLSGARRTGLRQGKTRTVTALIAVYKTLGGAPTATPLLTQARLQ